MNNKRLLSAAALTAVVASGALLIHREPSAHAAPATTPALPEVPVAKVLVQKVAPGVELTGTLSPVEHVALRARVPGFVEKVAFEEGELVRKGQLMFKLDERPYRATLARARAEFERTKAQEALAKLKLERGDKLVPGGVIAPSAHDALSAELAQAQAATLAARAAAEAAELELGYTRVISPIDGRAGAVLVKAGNLVSGGADTATLLTTVVSVAPMYVDFDVDEPTYRRLATHHTSNDSSEVRVGLSDEPGYGHLAELDFVANVLDADTGTARARALLRNEAGSMRPGLFARVRLSTEAARDTVLVDDRAIHTDQAGRYVLVVDGGGTVAQRHVQVGGTAHGLRVISAGLSPEDRVVMSGMVRPGMQVKPRVVAMAGEKASFAVRSVP